MNTRSFFIFQIRQSSFGVDARLVRETIRLPELVPIEEVPPCIVGVFNLRGRMVPVMDLSIRFGHPPLRYRLADNVVVIEDGGRSLGLIVNEVEDVVPLASEEIEPAPFPGREGSPHPSFIVGEAQAGEKLVMILDSTAVLDFEFQVPEAIAAEMPAGYFCPEAEAREMEIFHRRAVDLAKPPEGEDQAGRVPIAVIELSGEFFGIEMKVVREFSNLRSLTPVPCCPDHVIGSMNLRGTILTVVDLRKSLGLALRAPSPSSRVAVTLCGELPVGVLVDDILDVVSLNPAALFPVPAAVRTVAETFIVGTVPCAGKALMVINLPEILAQESLIVTE